MSVYGLSLSLLCHSCYGFDLLGLGLLYVMNTFLPCIAGKSNFLERNTLKLIPVLLLRVRTKEEQERLDELEKLLSAGGEIRPLADSDA